VIGQLRGKIVSEDTPGELVLDVGGVGYELKTPVGVSGRTERATDGSITLSVHTHVRQDTFELFGFASEFERRVFRMLIAVPNVGPRTAVLILSAMAVSDLVLAVRAGDAATLCRVPGVGKKTAARLVLELKEKLPAADELAAGKPLAGDQTRLLVAALTNMGYRPAEAESAVRALGERARSQPMGELLREALARLTPR
jgi:holliday junction DNA helicase RuvA